MTAAEGYEHTRLRSEKSKTDKKANNAYLPFRH